MANVQIKSEKLTPFGGIFPIMEQFDALLAQTIDSTLGMRCKWYGYQYSEILRSLMCVYLCGGSCVEDVTTHLMRHLSLHPSLRTCSADTILRAIEELTCENTTYQTAISSTFPSTAKKTVCYPWRHSIRKTLQHPGSAPHSESVLSVEGNTRCLRHKSHNQDGCQAAMVFA